MPKIDDNKLGVLSAYEKGELKSVATKAGLEKFKAAARATAIKDWRVNIRLSSSDLSDIQAKALEQGVPYQTLIASVLHKYVTGHLADASRWGGRPDPCPHSQAAWPSGRLIPSKLTYLSPRATRTTDRTPWPRSALQTTKRSANSGCGLLGTQN